MEQENIKNIQPSLESVREQFEAWRSTKKNRREQIPEGLWRAAVSLTKKYSINIVSKNLCLNHTVLKNRVHGQSDGQVIKSEPPHTFIELDHTKTFHTSECIVEMEDPTGSRLRMQFRGRTDFDLMELGKAFWRKGK